MATTRRQVLRRAGDRLLARARAGSSNRDAQISTQACPSPYPIKG